MLLLMMMLLSASRPLLCQSEVSAQARALALASAQALDVVWLALASAVASAVASAAALAVALAQVLAAQVLAQVLALVLVASTCVGRTCRAVADRHSRSPAFFFSSSDRALRFFLLLSYEAICFICLADLHVAEWLVFVSPLVRCSLLMSHQDVIDVGIVGIGSNRLLTCTNLPNS
jgi:hypothetical protein